MLYPDIDDIFRLFFMKTVENLYKSALGENIRRIRKRIGFTQDAFSEKIGIEPSSLSNIENGKSFPSAFTLIQIQQKFNISAEEIFDIEHLKDINSIEKDLQKSVERLNPDKKRILWKIVKMLDF